MLSLDRAHDSVFVWRGGIFLEKGTRCAGLVFSIFGTAEWDPKIFSTFISKDQGNVCWDSFDSSSRHHDLRCNHTIPGILQQTTRWRTQIVNSTCTYAQFIDMLISKECPWFNFVNYGGECAIGMGRQIFGSEGTPLFSSMTFRNLGLLVAFHIIIIGLSSYRPGWKACSMVLIWAEISTGGCTYLEEPSLSARLKLYHGYCGGVNWSPIPLVPRDFLCTISLWRTHPTHLPHRPGVQSGDPDSQFSRKWRDIGSLCKMALSVRFLRL